MYRVRHRSHTCHANQLYLSSILRRKTTKSDPLLPQHAYLPSRQLLTYNPPLSAYRLKDLYQDDLREADMKLHFRCFENMLIETSGRLTTHHSVILASR